MIPAHADLRRLLEEALQGAIQQTRCRGAAIVRRDGLVIASRLAGRDSRITAATAASILGAAEVVAGELVEGAIKEIVVSTTGGKIVSITAGPDAIILAVYDQSVNLGLALLGLSQLADRIAATLGNA